MHSATPFLFILGALSSVSTAAPHGARTTTPEEGHCPGPNPPSHLLPAKISQYDISLSQRLPKHYAHEEYGLITRKGETVEATIAEFDLSSYKTIPSSCNFIFRMRNPNYEQSHFTRTAVFKLFGVRPHGFDLEGEPSYLRLQQHDYGILGPVVDDIQDYVKSIKTTSEELGRANNVTLFLGPDDVEGTIRFHPSGEEEGAFLDCGDPSEH